MKLFGNQMNILEASLNASTLKHRVISNNIANVDTENYKSKGVNFQAELQRALSGNSNMSTHRTNSKHIPFSTDSKGFVPTPTTFTRTNTSINNNGNNVDMDFEMSELAKNQLLYNALIERTRGKFNKLQSVIKGGN